MTNRIRKTAIPGLGSRILELRHSLGLSQQVLATRAGLSIPRLAEAERYGAATTATLNALARVFEVSVDELTGRKAGGQ